MNHQVSDGTRAGYSEVRFDVKPSVEIREELKAAGFRWAVTSACWYGRTAKLPARYQSAAPCPVKARIVAESAEVSVLRAELDSLRALLAEMKAGSVGAVSIAATGVATPAAPPVPPVAAPAPKARKPVTPQVAPTWRTGVAIGRTIAVDGAGQWGG